MRTLLPIEDRIERAAQLVLRARVFFDIWFYFESNDTRPSLLDIMQEFSEFFRFAPHAHFVAFVVTTAALFDRRRDTISLPGLVREMEQANRLPTRTQADLNALIKQAQPLAAKIVLLRHNAFAHRSSTLSYDDAFKAAAVTAAQMRDLTDTALKIANHLARAIGRTEHFFNELPRADAETMMKALKKGRRRPTITGGEPS